MMSLLTLMMVMMTVDPEDDGAVVEVERFRTTTGLRLQVFCAHIL